MMKTLQETCKNYNLIADYQQRPHMYDIFESTLKNHTKKAKATADITNTNLFVAEALGPIFICMHIVINCASVLSGDTKLGAFLATIAVYKEFSHVNSEVYISLMALAGSL